MFKIVVIFMQINPRTTICLDHFTVDSFFWKKSCLGKRRRYLKPDAIPTIFQWTAKRKHRRLVLRADASTLDANLDTTATLSADELNSDEQPISDR